MSDKAILEETVKDDEREEPKEPKEKKKSAYLHDMDLAQHEYRKFLMITVGGIVASLALIILLFFTITNLSARMTYETSLSMKKSMLKENVDNFISYIDAEVEASKAEDPSLDSEGEEAVAYETAYRKIYSETHADGTYMWVQKILNYDGGDNYAIRLIHPNLSDTEGSYLSTETVNEMGMKAYEEELEGVKENGAVYLNYAFKKLNSDEVTEKITYSCLYKRFDWIVCMGVNIDDLYMYRKQAHDNVRHYQALLLIVVAVAWTIFFGIMSYGYRKTKIGAYENRNRELRDKLEYDSLTKARSRMYGEALLNKSFTAFKEGEENILLLIMDVDHFKQFNDGYGHELGDKVLKSFVQAVHATIRSEDTIIRWGGDEFIVVLKNVPPLFQPEAADRILNAVRSIRIDELPEGKGITASMGFAYFDETDEDAKSTLARADEALYRAKEAGRNNWKI